MEVEAKIAEKNEEEEEESFPMFEFDFDLKFDGPHISINSDSMSSVVAPRSFNYWNELVPELKTLVVEKMDYFTRTRLSFCSKDDNDVVDSAPIEIAVLEMKDNGDMDYEVYPNEEVDSVYVRIDFDEKSTNNSKIELHFVKWDGYTEVAWRSFPPRQRPIKKSIILPNSDNYESAVKFVEKWMKKSRYGVKDLTFEMERWPIETSNIPNLHRCTSIRLCNENEEMLKWWLRKTNPEKLKRLQLLNNFSDGILPQELLSMDHIKMCDSLRIWGSCNFTDEQFLSLKGRFIKIESNTITDEAINRFITNWTRGKVREDFVILSIWWSREYNKAKIVKNLTVRPWDDDFEREAAGFTDDWARVCGRGDASQIYKIDGSGISATMDLSSDRITFSVTGTLIEWGGRNIPNYHIPLEF